MEMHIEMLRRDFRSIVERAAGGESIPSVHFGDEMFATLVEEVVRGKPLRVQATPADLRKAGVI